MISTFGLPLCFLLRFLCRLIEILQIACWNKNQMKNKICMAHRWFLSVNVCIILWACVCVCMYIYVCVCVFVRLCVWLTKLRISNFSEFLLRTPSIQSSYTPVNQWEENTFLLYKHLQNIHSMHFQIEILNNSYNGFNAVFLIALFVCAQLKFDFNATKIRSLAVYSFSYNQQ